MGKLELLAIPNPCTASWGAMAGDEKVRHCTQCHLDVFNLSAMTREEAERLVDERDGQICVRFFQRHDGTVITQDCEPLRAEARPCVPRSAPLALSADPAAPPFAMAAAPKPVVPPPLPPRPLMGAPPPIRAAVAAWATPDGRLERGTLLSEISRAIRVAFDAEVAEAKMRTLETWLHADPAHRPAECSRCHGPLWLLASGKAAPVGAEERKARTTFVKELTAPVEAAFDADRAQRLLREVKRTPAGPGMFTCPHCLTLAVVPPV